MASKLKSASGSSSALSKNPAHDRSELSLAEHARFRQSLTRQLRRFLSDTAILPEQDLKDFTSLVQTYAGQEIPVDWRKVKPPQEAQILDYDALEKVPDDPELTHVLLDKLVICKLNGGLGTTMGCQGPKSCLEVHPDRTFLDLTVRQVETLNIRYGVDVPLLLMNSYKTNAETQAYVRKYEDHNIRIHMFMQHCFPRISKETLLPSTRAPFSPDDQDSWYPPGHGDIYSCLFSSGLLENLINQGKEYIFISNIDNLSATVDLNLLYHLMSNDILYCMEVTDKTRADILGGTLVEYNGKVRLMEVAEVPKRHRQDFMNIETFRFFNTNNLWVNLRAIQRLYASGMLRSDVIVQQKLVGGTKVLQLETAAGAAIKFFPNAIGLRVSRDRFLPVKTTADLLAVQSNLYTIKHGSLKLNPKRQFPSIPIIKLGPEFQTVEDYELRMEHGVPDIVDLDHLTVSGNVFFGPEVVLRGTVIIVANDGSRIDIPAGSVLENVVVTGSLRVVAH